MFSGGKLSLGGGALAVADDYSNMESYGSENVGVEGFGSVDPSQEWSLFYTEDDVPYWYSNVTAER